VPLTPEQSARLGSLYETYGRRLVGYAYSQLTRRSKSGADAYTLAQDIAQSVWESVARSGGDLVGDEPLTEDETRARLFGRVKHQVGWHFGNARSNETPVDFADQVTCNRLCPLMPSNCALIEIPAYLAKMVDVLPEQERAALLLRLDGMDPRTMAEHLGCGDTTATHLADAAVLLLQIDNPELSREPVELASLPVWEQKALAEFDPARRESLRLEAPTRQAIVLKHQGVGKREIRERLGLKHDHVAAVARCVSARKPSGATATPQARSTGRRANSKFAEVATALRHDIETMRPGDRLPRRVDLMQRFGVGSRTIDNAWAVLRREGLIEANGVYGYTVVRTQSDMERAA
jgi:hypothetical protein